MSAPSSIYQQLRNTALRAQGYAADVAGVATRLVESLLGAVLPVTLDKTRWVLPEDELEEELDDPAVAAYPFYYDIPVAGVTAKDRVDVTFTPACVDTAAGFGMSSTTEALAGAVRVRCRTQPNENLQAQCWIYHGKE